MPKPLSDEMEFQYEQSARMLQSRDKWRGGKAPPSRVALVLHIGHRNWPMKRSGRHFGVPDRMLNVLVPDSLEDPIRSLA